MWKKIESQGNLSSLINPFWYYSESWSERKISILSLDIEEAEAPSIDWDPLWILVQIQYMGLFSFTFNLGIIIVAPLVVKLQSLV